MNVFVLGAGASCHAGYPLAGDLGTRLYDWVVGAKPTDLRPSWRLSEYRERLERLLKHFGTLDNFEGLVTEIDGLITRGKGEVPTGYGSPTYVAVDLRSAIADYFDQLSSLPAPLYEGLANIAQPEDVIIIFNYDVAIERALRTIGLWDISDGYGFRVLPTGSSAVRVLKLHGSTNWVTCLGPDGAVSTGDPCSGRPAFRPQDLAYLGYSGSDPDYRVGGTTGPRLILPVQNKVFHPGLWEFLEALWKQAADALAEAAEINIIGYSMPEEDARARDLLLTQANRSALLRICCLRDGERICEMFKESGCKHVSDLQSFQQWADFMASCEQHSRHPAQPPQSSAAHCLPTGC